MTTVYSNLYHRPNRYTATPGAGSSSTSGGTLCYTYASDAGDVIRRTNAHSSEGYELVYSPLGHLERATVLATGATVSYETDPLGCRVARKVKGALTHGWLYDGPLSPVAELYPNGSNPLTDEYDNYALEWGHNQQQPSPWP